MSPLLALLAFQSAAFDPVKDPAYAKPVTVELAMSPLRTVVAALSKASGQPLDVSGVVGDWKATVLVKGLPAGRTMEALADALGLEWRHDSDAVRLARPDGAAVAEANYRRQEVALAQRGLAGNAVPGVAGVEPPVPNDPRVRPRRGDRATPGKKAYARFDANLLSMEVAGAQPASRLLPEAPSGDLPFAKAVVAWPTAPQEIDPAWGVPVAPTLPASTWENGGYSPTDLLVAWHAASGLPVVADAFRIPARGGAMAPTSAFGSLQTLASGEGMYLKLAGGVARLRHPAFWRLREQEVPESSWSLLERSGKVDLTSLSTFAARLTPQQAAAFRSHEAPLSHVPTGAIREGYPALILWAALPGAARTAILAGRPVGLAEVRGATSAYLYALQEAPYYQGGDPTAMLAMNPAKIGIFGKPGPNSIEIRLAGERGDGVYYILPL